MRKDKKKNEMRGKITIMLRNESHDEQNYPCYVKMDYSDGSPLSFDTTEHAKVWLKSNAEANHNYLIVQIKTELKLEQQTINKLIAAPPSVA